MAIKQLSYLDVPSELRSASAGAVLNHLRAVASSTASTQDQRDFAKARIGYIHRWVSGDISVPPWEDKDLVSFDPLPAPVEEPVVVAGPSSLPETTSEE